MRRTPAWRVAAVAAAALAVAYAVLSVVESRGGTLLPVPVVAWLVELVIAGVVGVLGWQVRQYARGKRPQTDVLVAARTVVLATASAYTGAVLVGWYGAQVLLTIGDLEYALRREVATTAGVAALAAVVLAVVGVVAERWCEVPPPDDDDEGGAGASAASGSAA
jgi:hypothetical protein